MKKAIKFLFTGAMMKEMAGSRPLTDKERWTWLIGTYSLVAQILFYQWKESQYEENALTASESLLNEVDILRKENRRLVQENQQLRLSRAMPGGSYTETGVPIREPYDDRIEF